VTIEGPQFDPPVDISLDDGQWMRIQGAQHHQADSSPLKKLPTAETVLRVVCTHGGRRRLFAVVTRPKRDVTGYDSVVFGVPPNSPIGDRAPSEPRVVFVGMPAGVRHWLCACGRLHPVDLDILWQHADRLRYSKYPARVIDVSECRPQTEPA